MSRRRVRGRCIYRRPWTGTIGIIRKKEDSDMKVRKQSHLKCPTEAQEAKKLMQWANQHPICKEYLIHYPLGGRRNLLEAIEFKRQGAKAGVSDYFLAYPVCYYAISYSGLWIELKRINSTLSKPSRKQLQWLSRMENNGYAVGIAYGADQAIDLINSYLSGNLKK